MRLRLVVTRSKKSQEKDNYRLRAGRGPLGTHVHRAERQVCENATVLNMWGDLAHKGRKPNYEKRRRSPRVDDKSGKRRAPSQTCPVVPKLDRSQKKQS